MRSTDELERYLLTLDDESFFAVVRNYLGPIRTPFNKPDLVARLIEFLRRTETRERIVALLSTRDLRILSAIELLGDPSLDRLMQFLGKERTGLTAALFNLRDRLLVIESESGMRLAINPVLAPQLGQDLLTPRHIVTGVPFEPPESPDPPPWWMPSLATALLAFLRRVPELFTQNGAIRKKTQGALSEQFGPLFSGEQGRVRLEEVLVAFENLTLLARRDGMVRLNFGAWEALGELPYRWIVALFWAATLTGSIERVFQYARLLMTTIAIVPFERSFTADELTRLMHLALAEEMVPIDVETVRRLALFGIIIEVDSDDTRYRLNRSVPTLLEESEHASHVVVHGNMEVVVPPDTPFANAVTVARLAELTRYDLAPTYILTRDSIGEATRAGIGVPLELLREVVNDVVPQNVRFLLSRWSERARAVRLVDATVLIAGEEEARVLAEYPEFLEQVSERPAPTVFILRRTRVSRVHELIARLGLAEVLSVETDEEERLPVPEYDVLYRRATQPALTSRTAGEIAAILKAVTNGEGTKSTRLADDDPRAELRRVLESLEIGEDERRELLLRIERGLILFPEQLRGEIRIGHTTEARGLDYLGKIRLIEQALSVGDMLEIVMRDSREPERMLVRPREIVQNGKDLMLRAVREPSGEAIKIRIRRISLVRRLSGTLIRR